MLRHPYWKLDADHRPQKVATISEWADWFGTFRNRTVGRDELEPGILVSTVFMGIDHRHFGEGPPILFETMVFGLNLEDEAFTNRYSTWDDAETGHAATLRKVKEIIAKAAKAVNCYDNETRRS